MSRPPDRHALDLLTEFAAYAAAVGPAHDAALVARGVPHGWLGSGTARYGVVRARLDRSSGLWAPWPDGRQVVALPEPPLSDPSDSAWPTREITDLVAFAPGGPGRWGRRTDLAVVLGAEAIEEAMYRDVPLILHETPMDWLRACGVGAVVLDWDACLHLHLGGASEIQCVGLDLAERLDRALTARVRHGTRITVASSAEAA